MAEIFRVVDVAASCTTSSMYKTQFGPGALRSDRPEQPVVVVLPRDDGAREVEDGVLEQAGLDEHEDVDDAARASVAVIERVDGFELVVRDGHAHQRVDVVVGVDEPLPLRQLLADQVGALAPSTPSLIVLESARKLNASWGCVT